jgi:hypothetical protein
MHNCEFFPNFHFREEVRSREARSITVPSNELSEILMDFRV